MASRNTAGFVYLRFESTQSAISAQRALHGRWFAGKMITASFMVTLIGLTFWTSTINDDVSLTRKLKPFMHAGAPVLRG